jgi:hypothetical protein
MFRKIIPEVKDVYAQTSNEAVCNLLNIIPIIAVAILLVAGIFLLIPKGGSGDSGL